MGNYKKRRASPGNYSKPNGWATFGKLAFAFILFDVCVFLVTAASVLFR